MTVVSDFIAFFIISAKFFLACMTNALFMTNASFLFSSHFFHSLLFSKHNLRFYKSFLDNLCLYNNYVCFLKYEMNNL